MTVAGPGRCVLTTALNQPACRQVHLEGSGSVGFLEQSEAGLQPSGQTDGQRVYRVIQRPIPHGVLE